MLRSQKFKNLLSFEGEEGSSLVAYVALLELLGKLQEVGDFEVDIKEESFEEKFE